MIEIVDAALLAAVTGALGGQNGTRESGVAAAIGTAFGAGPVTAKVYSASDTLLCTVVLGPMTVDLESSPRTVTPGARVSYTGATAGTPAYILLGDGDTDLLSVPAGTGVGDVVRFLAPVDPAVPVGVNGLTFYVATLDSVGEQFTWLTVPTIEFIRGVAGSVAVGGFVSPAGSIAHNGAPLPDGVVFDPVAQEFRYDGRDAVGSTDGHVLTAGPLADVALTATVTGVVPFVFAMPFKQGDAPLSIASDVPSFQATIKARWPDGSVKHAICAGLAQMTAGEPLAVRLLPGGAASGAPLSISDLRAAVSAGDMVVTIGSLGSVDLADMLAADSTGRTSAGIHQQWVSGPVMSWWYACSPVPGSSHLMLWVSVRLYQGDAVEVFPWIENGWLGLSGQTAQGPHAISVSVGGVVRYSQSVTIRHHTRLPLVAGASWSYWLDGVERTVTPRHDTEYMQASRVVPSYYQGAPLPSAYAAGDLETYTPNAGGNIGLAPGFARQIGPIPNWAALHLVSNADARAWRFVIVNALCSGAHAYHYRNEATNDWPTLAELQDYSLSYTGSGNVNPPAGSGGFNTVYGGSEARPESYRRGSTGFYAYLLTGEAWFLDAQIATVTWSFMEYSRQQRETTAMIFAAWKNIRNLAADLRDLGQLLAVLPVDHPFLASAKTSWQNTIDYYHARSVAGTRNSGAWVNSLGVPMFSGLESVSPYDTGQVTGKWWDAPWMVNYWPVFLTHVRDAGPAQDSATAAKLDEFLDFLFQHPVGLAGDVQAGGWDYRRNAYVVPYATDGVGQPPESWMASWGAAYAAYKAGVFVRKGGSALSDVSSGSTTVMVVAGGDGTAEEAANAISLSTYSGLSDLMAALSCAVQRGATGAASARARMLAATNIAAATDTAWRTTPVWAVVPRSEA